MFYQLGDLHASEPNYQEAIKYYEMGIKKLDQWAKDLPPNRLYVVYKRRMHVKKSFQKSTPKIDLQSRKCDAILFVLFEKICL